MSGADTGQWCEPDDCPASICNGPHVSHHCPNGDLVTSRADDTTPCPFCGHVNGLGLDPSPRCTEHTVAKPRPRGEGLW